MSVVSMMMGGESPVHESQGSEEKIFVSVRLRPLNDREISRNDVLDWECINDNTIVFKTSMPERSLFPTAYTFDRVFGTECSTKQVYDEGAKELVLSVLNGMNCTIFAYGQTSSGKTYTMSGITQFAVTDIYNYIEKHKEREFQLKFSAMEIYNEAVRDLLSHDSTPLRLLDDPERGTVVEKLTEETLVDSNHLQELLSICEAQRQIGETSLNETSSRSHQILRLTVESSSRENLSSGKCSTLTAAVNFVDLAGSERASQTLAAGARLKEGSHINRSLLTLGTVIRKLSKGRNGHVPYRDSKLTRILQNSLGGNARTAIICTMNPAHCHVEQSKNTLSFASCAKEVATNAQVNLVMSDKALVKQLQKELARLESQLSSLMSTSAGNSAVLLREKDHIIAKKDKEIKELTCQRDIAQSRLEDLLKTVAEDRSLRIYEYAASESSEGINHSRGRTTSFTSEDLNEHVSNNQIFEIPEAAEENFLLDDGTPRFLGPDPCPGWEDTAHRKNEESKDICREVQSIKLEEPTMKGKADLLPSPEEGGKEAQIGDVNERQVPTTSEEDKELTQIDLDNCYQALKQQIQELQRTIDQLAQCTPSEEVMSNSKRLTWTRSKSKRSVLMTIPSDFWPGNEDEDEQSPPAVSEMEFPGRPEDFEGRLPGAEADAEIRDTSLGDAAVEEEIVKEIDIQVDDTTSVLDLASGLNKMPKFNPLTPISDILETGTSDGRRGTLPFLREVRGGRQHHSDWPQRFDKYRRRIIELWARCNVPLVHRSYFFLTFKGDQSDNVYMEVELRRLYFLKDIASNGTTAMIDGQIVSQATSLKALNRERQFLAKQLQKKYGKKEREDLYQKWNIKLDTKQRSLQLACHLWTETKDMKHIRESAVLVAKLAGFIEPRHCPKEFFGLSFLTPPVGLKTSSWRDNVSSLL
ncbi:hypothetical protein K2173_007313 [Erythroxylum novogranatense]|uniref:Kinesin motor domain-containing protein n=1 Tax=Erythroxylum novogranatense TaxID=1862640 RepID=A0AAV8T785_9ROSI|nr:hypothetical protein K2173_007313 [Erythroxylum novogranatense]